ncbi:MAG: pyruvate kinase [Gammaproteobacteria bacterium]|nr:pyruvate kinase [Gammaproteobacteria bacterium]
MRRRTKIVATLGPATDDPKVLRELFIAGVNVVRINFSHGSHDEQQERIELVRRVSAAVHRDIAVLGDLQGPKIRIQKFRDGSVILKNNAPFILDAALRPNDGDEHRVGLTYKKLCQDVAAGDLLLLDDGQLSMEVKKVVGKRIHCQVKRGGRLSNNKGINRMGGGLTAEALTAKDRKDIRFAAEIGVDYLAISFPRDAKDVERARRLLRKAGGKGFIIAKIERAEAVTNIREIVDAADAVMVARGDLGVEIGDAELPAVQKQIIELTRDRNSVVITATQMMESMINSAVPTRAEVLDVANAVLDGTDAVMLSAETAAGNFPVETVTAMDRVCRGAERHKLTQVSQHRMQERFEFVDEAIAMATMYTANHLDVKAIVALTESGSTSLWASRIRSGKPIFAVTRHEATRRRVALYRGVYPIDFNINDWPPAQAEARLLRQMKTKKIVSSGDWVILTKGDHSGVSGATNTMKILRVK